MRTSKQLKQKRKLRIRKKINGTAEKPRLTVFKSNRFIYAQVIDDENQKTLASASSSKMKETGLKAAEMVGEMIAKNAQKVKIESVIFDRNGKKYHGAIKALADSARKAGLQF